MGDNILYYGDNLPILRQHIGDESIDLIYLDPPFSSNRNYNVLFKEENGTASAAQVHAFEDTWHWNDASEEALADIIQNAPSRLVELVKGFLSFLGRNQFTAYLVMMTPRLLELHRVLNKTGSLYLHCDPTASHYLKLILDQIFRVANFRNEIIWFYRRWTAPSHAFQRMHDILLFYAKSSDHQLNRIYIEPTEGQKGKQKRGWDRNSVIIDGRRQPQLIIYDRAKVQQAIENGKIRLSEYARVIEVNKVGQTTAPDVWEINLLNSQARERLGYPTQKPEALLERIIKASSNEGDLVLDPFCGCGTTLAVAERLRRKWIGIDITHLAIALMKSRLEDTFGGKVKYKVIGEPVDLSGAHALAQQNRYQFQWWALSLIRARPVDQKKKGADRGIDGVKYINATPWEEKPKIIRIVVQVKSGHVSVKDIREFKAVTGNAKAEMGVFLTLSDPTRPMLEEALSAGYYKPNIVGEVQYIQCPKIQILTVEELLSGKKVQYPIHEDMTFRRAERVKEQDKREQLDLL